MWGSVWRICLWILELKGLMAWAWCSPHVRHQGRVVWKVDNAIHWININLYSVDNAIDFPNTYPLDRDLSGGQHYPTSEQPEPGFQHLGNFCFWNPETGRFLLQESGILGFEIHKSAHRIWNPTSDWNSDPSLTDKESRIQYLESRIHNMEFWIQDGLGLPDTGWSYDCSKISKVNH